MDKLINFQNDIFKRISKAKINFKKSPKERLTKEYMESRLESLEQLWLEFLTGHKELMRSYEPAKLNEMDYIRNDIYETCEELYEEYKCELKLKLLEFVNKSETNNTKFCNSTQVRLPKLIIHPFSGKYSEWNTFRDLFRSLVHNNDNLDNVQKLLYLKGYLKGEAEQLISRISIADENYVRSWQLLEERYNNRKYICHQALYKMFNLRKLSAESASGLKELVDTTDDCLATLSNLNVNVNDWDVFIIFLLSMKLDTETHRQWELYVNSNTSSEELPKYKQFKEFLTQRFRAIEFLDPKSIVGKLKSMHTSTIQCPFCEGEHKLYSCTGFRESSIKVRRNFVKTKNICFGCLGNNHLVKDCKSNYRCSICKSKHHILLHPSRESTSNEMAEVVANAVTTDLNDIENLESSSSASGSVVSCFTKKSNQILLATALVDAESNTGNMYTIRALLDQGSQTSFITENMVQQIRTQKYPSNVEITGVGGNKTLTCKAMVIVEIASRVHPGVVIKVKAYVVKSITSLLPCKQVRNVKWLELHKIALADPSYHTPNRIDMLLGAEIHAQILRPGLKKCPKDLLVAQDTSLGWVLSGSIASTQTTNNFRVMHSLQNSDELLKKFWELEDDIPLPKDKLLTEEEERCEKIFNTTTTRDEEGRYIVRLPLRNSNTEVSNSLKIAERRLLSLEKRLKVNGLQNKYKEVMHEYISLNHMELIPENEISNPKAVYLPHHAVIREDKQTTKIRAVFDASCKGNNNKSLNDNLLVGPKLQLELRHLVMKWRMSRICLTADIEKMYRQVKVDKEDKDLQRILWRDNSDDKIQHYRMLRITFGVASAPYLAVKALQQVGKDEGFNYPVAREAVLSQFYMDDLLTGCENIDEGMVLYREMNELLAKGGFRLQKWTSNSDELLEKMKESEKKRKVVVTDMNELEEELKIKTDEVIKIVGLTWKRRDDSFHYKVDLPDEQGPGTKRNIISEICRFYDPIGWVAPCIIISKVLIQKLWLAGIDWDDCAPGNILNEWNRYKNELKILNNVVIPRWLGTRIGDTIELHGFSDASKDAYGAVIYARVIGLKGDINVTLLTAKTKVAPVKQISIPRLELCGAVLLTRLMMETASVMNVQKTNLHAYTDSNVVLAWINNHPSRWKVFVANRVTEIIQNLDSHHWSYVSSKCNPADVASRGQSPAELLKNTMWFEGPDFLKTETIMYKKPKIKETNLEEVKQNLNTHVAVTLNPIIERFSTLTRMVRVMAYCRRFLRNLKLRKQERQVGFLTIQEQNNTVKFLIRQCQSHNFSKDIDIIRTKHDLPKGSKQARDRSLNPFLDKDEILRVGGRLELSMLDAARKHPMILPKESPFTELVIADAHTRTLHGGLRLMLSYLSSTYYILGCKSVIKKIIHKCVKCIRYKAGTNNQLMGQLPAARVTPTRPFKCSGVDYAGPINIRTSRGRGHKSHKGYICIFVCMVTRAVHIEVVSDLTTAGFLAAFKRFVARRGLCTDLWSDNGTNFVGASRELQDLFTHEKSSLLVDVAQALASKGTTWHFIPPHSPNFGGLWEAGVRSTKFHLKRVIGETTLTFEELSTVLVQVEACLNSRPLSRVDTESDALDVLTPGHFLVGEPLVTAPDLNFETSNVTNLRRWQLTQRILQNFWRRWSQEYLVQFLHRYRWSRRTPEPNVGDVVLVKENGLPPCKWLMGRIVTKHPGADNVTRVVTLRTKNSLIKRPTSKLCLLPVAS